MGNESYQLPKTATPSLPQAGREQQWEVADRLIAEGASSLSIDEHGFCYLYYVIYFGQRDRYSKLRAKHAIDPNWSFRGRSSLAIALHAGQLALANELESLGAEFQDQHSPHPAKKTYNKYRIQHGDLKWFEEVFLPKFRSDRFQITTVLSYFLAQRGPIAEQGIALCLANLTSPLRYQRFYQSDNPLGIQHPLLGAVIVGNQANIERIMAHEPNCLQETLQRTIVDKDRGGFRGAKAHHVAAAYGQIHLFEYLHQQGIDLSSYKENFYNLWYWAGPNRVEEILLENDDAEGLQEFLRWVPFEKLDVEFLKTAMNHARGGKDAIYRFLLTLPPEVIKTHRKGLSLNYALGDACASGDIAQVKWLLEMGAKMGEGIIVCTDTASPMHRAIEQRHIRVVEALIQHVTFNEVEQKLATEFAIKHRQAEMLKLMEEKGFQRQPMYFGNTHEVLREVFQGAIGDESRWQKWDEFKSTCVTLLKAIKGALNPDDALYDLRKQFGFDIPIMLSLPLTIDGKTQPLMHWAFEWDIRSVFGDNAWRIKHHPDPQGLTVLHKILLLPEKEAKSWLSTLKFSLSGYNSSYLTDRTPDGLSALDRAFASQKLWIFFEAFSETYTYGPLWLHLAANYGSVTLAKFYLEKKQDINQRDYQKNTPLIIAAKKGHLDLVKFFLCHLETIHLQSMNIFRNTALHEALLHDHLEVARELWLLMPESALDIKNRYGQTARQLAIEKGLLYLCQPTELPKVTREIDTALSQVRMKQLDEEARRMLRAVFNTATSQENPEQFVAAAVELKQEVGALAFLYLFGANKKRLTWPLQLYTGVAEKLVACSRHPNFEFSRFAKRNPNPVTGHLFVVEAQLIQLQRAHFASRIQPVHLSALITTMSTAHPLLRCPLSLEALDPVLREYAIFDKRCQSYLLRTLGAVQKEMAVLKNHLRDTQQNPTHLDDSLATLLAMVATIGYFHFDKFPYGEQTFAILSALKNPKGRMLQIRTGEGKSLTIALLAGFLGLLGIRVLVMTSSQGLAIRDCKTYRPFFNLLGLTCTDVCDQQNKTTPFEERILYGTITDFEWLVLKDAFRVPGKEKLTATSTLPFGIVDEGDDVLIDDQLSSARISHPHHESLTWVYQPIFDFVKNKDINLLQAPHILSQLKQYLVSYQGGIYEKSASQFSETQLRTWLSNAIHAYHKDIRGVHYIVQAGKIKIVKHRGTEEISEYTRWRGGRHQFLEIKEGLQPQPESFTLAGMGHPSFFKYHTSRLLSLTGTGPMPVEKEELEQTYGIDHYDIPTHRPCLRKTLPSEVCLTKENHHASLLDKIKRMTHEGRPILVLFGSIEETRNFSSFLHTEGFPHQVLNETQTTDRTAVLTNAGHAGIVTVATNVAARGTDIILSQDSLAAGGLFVLEAFYPSNLRIDEQAQGRAGRQGQPGSAQMVVCLDDELIIELLPERPVRETLAHDPRFFEILERLRDQQIQKLSFQRQLVSTKNGLYYEIVMRFSTLLKSCYQSLEDLSFLPIERHCKLLKYSQLDTNMPLHEPMFSTCRELAHRLIMQQEQAPVDWKPLLTLLKQTFFDYIKMEWAQFFTTLSEESNDNILQLHTDPNVYTAALFHRFYETCIYPIKPLLRNPQQGFCALLSLTIGLPTTYFDGLSCISSGAQAAEQRFSFWRKEVKSHYKNSTPSAMLQLSSK